MGAETDHLVSDLLLEAYDYRHRKEHHSQSQGYAYHGYTNSRRSNLSAPLLTEMYLSCDEKRYIHLQRSSGIGFEGFPEHDQRIRQVLLLQDIRHTHLILA